VFCLVFYRVNILKISFKRKKFFIHQRQKQVSFVCACFVPCVLRLLQLLVLKGMEVVCLLINRNESMAQWYPRVLDLVSTVLLWLEIEMMGRDPGSSPYLSGRLSNL
jgi:hypothetical protein